MSTLAHSKSMIGLSSEKSQHSAKVYPVGADQYELQVRFSPALPWPCCPPAGIGGDRGHAPVRPFPPP